MDSYIKYYKLSLNMINYTIILIKNEQRSIFNNLTNIQLSPKSPNNNLLTLTNI